MNKKLQSLLEQLSPEERAGAILSVQVSKGTLRGSRSPDDILAEVRDTIATRAVGEALVKARKQAGLKAKDVAATLAVSAPRVSQIEAETQNLKLSTLLEHADATGCDVEIVLRPRDPRLPVITAPLNSTRSKPKRSVSSL